jgi:hypothetical protein
MKGTVAQVLLARRQKGTVMNFGLGFRIVEQEREEAYERAMSRYRAEKAQEQRRATSLGGMGRGARRISRQEAIALLLKRGHIRGALKLQNGIR